MNRAHSRKGFTLTELLIAVAISGVVLACTFSVFLGLQRGAYATSDALAMKAHLRLAEQQLALDFRNAQSVVTSTSDTFKVKTRYYRDAANTTREITYSYDATSRSLVRTEGGKSRAIVNNLQAASFKYFQRSAVGGSVETLQASAVNAVSILVTPTPRKNTPGTRDDHQYTLATFQLRRIALP